jgi:DNA modification methylase
MKFDLHNVDCLEFMKSMPDKAFDLIATDPPYGVTSHEWDLTHFQEAAQRARHVCNLAKTSSGARLTRIILQSQSGELNKPQCKR